MFQMARASSKSGHVRYAPKADVNSGHQRLRDGPLRVDGTTVHVIQARSLSLKSCAPNSVIVNGP
jgi:hypothetical protein